MTRSFGDDRHASPRRAKISKRTVEAIGPEARRYIVWDTELPGFGLRVEPSGKKTFIARYRAGGGRSGKLRQATVGRYGTVTADEARITARKILGAAAGGGDPVGERHETRRIGITVTEVCDWYIGAAEAGRIVGRRGRPIKPSTLAMDRSRIERHVKPLVGRKSVAKLGPHDIEDMQAEIVAGRTAVAVTTQKKGARARGGATTGGEGVAARTLGMLKTIFEHAARKGIIASNPAKGARKLADQKRTMRLSVDQVRALGEAMRSKIDDNPTAIAAIRFMLMSGFRRNEALSIRPHSILASGGVDLRDTKSGPQIRPIGKAAMSVLTAQSASFTNGTWVFPADRGNGHFVGVPKALARISRQAGLSGVTPHVLRPHLRLDRRRTGLLRTRHSWAIGPCVRKRDERIRPSGLGVGSCGGSRRGSDCRCARREARCRCHSALRETARSCLREAMMQDDAADAFTVESEAAVIPEELAATLQLVSDLNEAFYEDARLRVFGSTPASTGTVAKDRAEMFLVLLAISTFLRKALPAVAQD